MPVREQANDQLRKGASQCRGQRKAGCAHVTEVAFEDEVGNRSRDESLIEIVDGVRGRPHAHPPPGSGARVGNVTPSRGEIVFVHALHAVGRSVVALPIL